MDFKTALTWLLPCIPFGVAANALRTGSFSVRHWMAPDGRLRRSEQPVKYWAYVAMMVAIGGIWLSAAG